MPIFGKKFKVLFLVQIYFSVSNFNFILVLKPAIVGRICNLLQSHKCSLAINRNSLVRGIVLQECFMYFKCGLE